MAGQWLRGLIAAAALAFCFANVAKADAMYEITTAVLDGRTLQDNDTINLTRMPINSSEVELCIRTENTVGWWKAIVLFDPRRTDWYREVMSVEGPNAIECGLISGRDLNRFEVVLARAGKFGVHSNIYHIVDAPQAFIAGNRFTFVWGKDH